MRLLVPFFICLFGCAVIWIMVDLYGNIYDFVDHKASFGLILKFYALQIPTMVVQTLPTIILVSALWTLLTLNRRSELVAFMAGGMSPIWLFIPFILFTTIWVAVLAYLLSGPAAEAAVKHDMILQEIKGEGSKGIQNLPYVDNPNHRVWFFQTLDTGHNSAKGVELLFRDSQGHDVQKYFAREATWNKEFWKFTGVREILYGAEDRVEDFPEIDLPDVTTPPLQLSLANSQAERMTVPQLSTYIATSPSSKEHLAGFRTEWWYRILHPLCLFIFLSFAFINGMHSDRRGAAMGWFAAILVIIGYNCVLGPSLSFGKFGRMPPLVAVLVAPVIFGALGLHLLALKYGWYWQIGETWKQWRGRGVKSAA
jgi:lipopolysaccharide export LptBFGC system permease protein LptF